jgi:hypothetical protein
MMYKHILGLLAMLSVVAAQKLTSAKLLKCKEKLVDLKSQVNELKTNLTSIDEEISTRLSRSVVGTDAIYAMDATLSATTKCGQQDITGWTTNLDTYYAAGGSTLVSNTYFVNGIFTAPVAGYYNICGFFRFRNSGNANDVSIYKGTARVASFGDAIGNDWRSTGTCTIQSLAAADQIKMRQESTGGNDCIEETGWFYARFSVYLIINSA